MENGLSHSGIVEELPPLYAPNVEELPLYAPNVEELPPLYAPNVGNLPPPYVPNVENLPPPYAPIANDPDDIVSEVVPSPKTALEKAQIADQIYTNAEINFKDYMEYKLKYYIYDVILSIVGAANNKDNFIVLHGGFAFESNFDKNFLFDKGTLDTVIKRLEDTGVKLDDAEIKKINGFQSVDIDSAYSGDKSYLLNSLIENFRAIKLKKILPYLVGYFNTILQKLEINYKQDLAEFYIDDTSDCRFVNTIRRRKAHGTGVDFIGWIIGNLLINLMEPMPLNSKHDMTRIRADAKKKPPIQNLDSLVEDSRLLSKFKNFHKRSKHLARIEVAELGKSLNYTIDTMGDIKYEFPVEPGVGEKTGLEIYNEVYHFMFKEESERRSYMGYMGAKYLAINSDMFLYNATFDKTKFKYKSFYEALHRSAKENEVKNKDSSDVTSYRFCNVCIFENRTINDYKIGEKIVTPSLFSSTLDRNMPKIVGFSNNHNDNIVFKIIVPKEWLHCGIRGTEHENELILIPGVELEITDISYIFVRHEAESIQKKMITLKVSNLHNILDEDYKTMVCSERVLYLNTFEEEGFFPEGLHTKKVTLGGESSSERYSGINLPRLLANHLIRPRSQSRAGYKVKLYGLSRGSDWIVPEYSIPFIQEAGVDIERFGDVVHVDGISFEKSFIDLYEAKIETYKEQYSSGNYTDVKQFLVENVMGPDVMLYPYIYKRLSEHSFPLNLVMGPEKMDSTILPTAIAVGGSTRKIVMTLGIVIIMVLIIAMIIWLIYLTYKVVVAEYNPL